LIKSEIGIAATFGSIGVILSNTFGGFLYDHYSPSVFYYFFAGMDTLLIFISVIFEILIFIYSKIRVYWLQNAKMTFSKINFGS